MLLAPGIGLAAVPITAASLLEAAGRTRIVVASKAPLRFSLFVLHNPNRLVLELEDVAADPLLAALAGQLAADDPFLKSVQVRRSPSSAANVQLEFGLKGEAEPAIRAIAPTGGRDYQVVLDIARAGAAPAPSSEAPHTPPPAAAAPTVELPLSRGDESNLVLLELRLDGQVLAEALPGYQYGRQTFLPLGELARLLTLAIRTQPGQGTAEGFVLSEARSFNLDVAQARLALGGRIELFDPALVRLRSDDVYIESALLSRWLPLDFDVNLSNQTLAVRPRERLPLQERLERERVGAKAGVAAGYEDPGYARQDQPYRLLGAPFIDQTFVVGMTTGNGSRQTNAGYTAYLTGDLLGVEAALFVSSTKENPTPDLRFTLARHDPDANLLGPLQARSVMFGSGVLMPSLPNVSSLSPAGKGHGLMVSNRPFNLPLGFDRHTLRGNLPPGWDVELYFNDGLVGFQASRPDGLYSFDDMPLVYGPNDFRLVFHGPLGQQRVERQSFPLDQSSTPPGAFYYNVAQHQDDAGQFRSLAQFEWGIDKHLTATGGLVRQPGLAGSHAGAGLYANLGLRAYWQSFIAGSEFFRSPQGGWLNESVLKTRIGDTAVSYSHTQLHDFASELLPPGNDPLRMRDKLRLDGAIPISGLLPRLPWAVELRREQAESGLASVALTGRITGVVERTLIANQLSWQRSAANTTAGGVLNLSRHVGDIGWSGQLGYAIKPEAKLESVAVAADKRLSENYVLNLGLVRTVAARETIYTASLNKSLGSYGMGLTTSYSSRGVWAVGLQLFVSMGREPRQGRWVFDALPKADSGAASVRVFLDGNANGVMDPGEEPIENVALTINGGRAPVRTDAAGIAWLDRLPTRQGVDIAVDAQTLEDPYWASQRKGVRVLPRPGRVAEVDFPVVLTSEIDGTVYFVDKAARRGIGDVLVELLDNERRVLASVKSGSDGYYIVPAVIQGRYVLRVSPEQLKQFELVDPGERAITIAPDGKFINGVEFLLRKK